MAEPHDELISRIDSARRQNETELQRALAALPKSDDYKRYLGPFEAFVEALYAIGAAALIPLCKTEADFQSQRQELAGWLIEEIMPRRGLDAAWANMPDELKRVSIVHEVPTGRLFEANPAPNFFESGQDELKSARPEACAHYQRYGYWERFAPEVVWFELRMSPRANTTVREALFWAIHRQDGFWTDKFRSRMTPRVRQAQDEQAGSEHSRAELLPLETQSTARKRGVRPDPEAAAKVAEIVARIAPDGDWRPKLDEICEALDEMKVPIPRRWRRQRQQGWTDYLERDHVVKAIEHRLTVAKRRPEHGSGTLS